MMQNPISHLTGAKDRLIECGILLSGTQDDVGNLQDALELDSLLLDLTLPEEATPEMREAARKIRAAAQITSAHLETICSKVFNARNVLSETLLNVMLALEMCDPPLALPGEIKLLEASTPSETVKGE